MTIQEIQVKERKQAALKVISLLKSLRKRKVGKKYYRTLAILANSIKSSGTYHSWGDGFQYFNEVEDAAYEIGEFCKTWGRIFITQTKEKFGTARVYCYFAYPSLHGLIWPGYYCKRPNYPQWLWSADIYYLSKIFAVISRLIGFNKYQTFIYRLAYKRALAKYPMIRNEILAGADHGELLKDL